MSNFSSQGSITIKRLRTGDTVFLTINLNGKPLFQAYNPQTGVVAPDWTVDANRPVLTPAAECTSGNTVTLSGHGWKYNGNTLTFNGSTSGDYTMDSTGKFGMNLTNGALKIFQNLASSSNQGNDTLTYSCVATVLGVEYNLSKTETVQIVSGGASSYAGVIIASTTQLSSTTTSATLNTQLWLSTNQISSYYVKWYKDNTEWTEKRGSSSITVTRSDVNGSQLFIAEFYLSSTETSYVARAGINIIDISDELMLVPYISSTYKEVDTNKSVTVKAKLIRTKDSAVLTPTSPTWSFQAYRVVVDDSSGTSTWEKKKETSTDSITITTSETDDTTSSPSKYYDIEVIAEIECTGYTVS